MASRVKKNWEIMGQNSSFYCTLFQAYLIRFSHYLTKLVPYSRKLLRSEIFADLPQLATNFMHAQDELHYLDSRGNLPPLKSVRLHENFPPCKNFPLYGTSAWLSLETIESGFMLCSLFIGTV